MRIFELFHQTSKDPRSGRTMPVSKNSTEWPDAWRTTFYKTYEKFKKIALPKKVLPEHSLESALYTRTSTREYSKDPLTLSDIGALLQHACGETTLLETDRLRRSYPSGGGRYPIETYLYILKDSEQLKAGLYHYAVAEHALEALYESPIPKEKVATLFTYPWVRNAAAILVLTANIHRTTHKYGDRGYRYALIEAGHIGQNVYLTANTLSLKCCGLGGTIDSALEKDMYIDGNTEFVVYSLVLGK